MKPYKDAMKKWVKDTGAGSGEEVRFVTWDQTSSWLEATDPRFQNFDSNRGEWLTWIYMLDKQFDNVLWSKYGTMRGIAARGDTGSSGSVAGSDFNSPSAGDNEFVNLVKANMENGRNVMERIAEALQLRISDRSDEKEAAVPDNVCNESTTSVVSRLTSPQSLDQVVSEKMAAINTLKRDKEDAEKNEGDAKARGPSRILTTGCC